jgi:uncharacterized protein (TIGR02594 family)
LALYGIKEKRGPANNPEIMEWAKDLGFKNYNADSIPWCGLFMAYVAKQAGWEDGIPSAPLWARNWRTFGRASRPAQLGDILVFSRGTAGHVGIYVGEDHDCFHVLGGNQGDRVSIVRINRDRLIAAREPKWRIAVPPNRRRVFLRATGAVSKGEA